MHMCKTSKQGPRHEGDHAGNEADRKIEASTTTSWGLQPWKSNAACTVGPGFSLADGTLPGNHAPLIYLERPTVRCSQNSCVGVHQLCCKASVMGSTTWFPCPCSHVKLVALSTCIDQPIKNMMQTDKASTVIVMKTWQDMLQKTCKTSEVQNFKTEHENCF